MAAPWLISHCYHFLFHWSSRRESLSLSLSHTNTLLIFRVYIYFILIIGSEFKPCTSLLKMQSGASWATLDQKKTHLFLQYSIFHIIIFLCCSPKSTLFVYQQAGGEGSLLLEGTRSLPQPSTSFPLIHFHISFKFLILIPL